MIIQHDGSKFVAKTSYDERFVVKGAGFRWDSLGKHWYSLNVDSAAKLLKYCDETARAVINGTYSARRESVEASRATDNDAIDIPAPAGLSYLPFQRAGVAYALKRKGTLIADEMGLGKTIQAIGIINALGAEQVRRVLVICPASLKLNWQRELSK